MTPPPGFSDEYYHDADLRIVQAIPASARDILDIACGEGRLGEVLKHLQPLRHITGIEHRHDFAKQAEGRVDNVIFGDIQQDTLPLATGSFDCIVASDLLSRCHHPRKILEQSLSLLRPSGHLIAAFQNLQHWSSFEALIRGEQPHYNQQSRSFTITEIIRLFLDAGFLPRIIDRRNIPCPAGWLDSAKPLASHQKLDPTTFSARVQTWQYFIEARPISDLPTHLDSPSITIGTCTNDPLVLQENLLASPCLQHGKHETLMVEGATSAAEGLNAVIAQAQHELVVLAHQDVYLPRWWIARLWQQYENARTLTGDKVGIMGVYGVTGNAQGISRSGRVCDRDFLLDEPASLPANTRSLDELVLITQKRSKLSFDPMLGFHLYGTDICLAAEQAGLSSVVVDAPCHHNSKQGDILPDAYQSSRRLLSGKWPHCLPIATPCGLVT